MKKKIILVLCALLLLLSACEEGAYDENPGISTGVPGKSEIVDDGADNLSTGIEKEEQKTDNLDESSLEEAGEGVIEIKNADIAEGIEAVLGKQGPFFSVEELQQVTKLYVSNMKSSDISELEFLENLVFLNISDTPLMSADIISELKKLQYLYMNNTGIDSIAFARELPELKVLSLCNNALTDLEGVEGLLCLKELYVEGNKIDNVWKYEEFCNGLTHCDIDFTEGQNGSVLFADEAMEETVREFIGNYTNPITESQLEEVIVLVVSDPVVCSVEDLVRCKNLFSLTLWNTSVTNYFPLMEMTSLEELIIATEEEIDAAMFKNHPSLSRVVINGEETIME